MHEHSGVIGVVLAGGGSRRMGRDKALLEWQGRPIIASIRDRLLAAGCATVVISRDAPGCVADHFPGLGPLAGIHAVVRRCPARGYLVAPVDMPLMPPALFAGLITAGLEHGYCYYRRSFLPCYLHGEAGLEALLALRLSRGERSLAGALRALAARALDGGDERLFLNANTPDNWRMANAFKEAGS